MTVLDKKLLRDLWRSKGMLAAIIAIVTVGMGCYVGFQATWRNMERARKSYYSACRMADFWIDLKKAPVTEIRRLADVPGVSQLRDRISFPVTVDLEDVDRPLGGQVLSLPPDPDPVLNGVVLRRGSYFTAERRNEVIVSEEFAAARGVSPGTFVDLVMKGQRKSLFVIGTATSSEYVYLAPPGSIVPEPANYGIFYVKREFAAETLGFEGAANSIVGLLTPEARRDPRPVLDRLEQMLARYGVFSTTARDQQSSNLALTSEMSGLRITATFMPAIFLSVAALVLNVLMTRMAENERTIVGTLKALGYGNWPIFRHFLMVGVFVGVAGALCGSGFGYWMSGALTEMYKEFFHFPDFHNDLYPGLVLVALVVSLGFALLGTARGVRSVLRLDPAESMRERPPAVVASIPLERWQWLWKRLDFRWQMVARSLYRQKARTLIAVFAAAMGSALLVATFGMIDSFNYMVSFQFEETLPADYSLSFREDEDSGSVLEARRMPGVTRVEPVFHVPCTFSSGLRRKRGVIQGLVAGSELTVPRDGYGRRVPVPPAGLLMTRRMADQLGVGPGDTLHFVPVRGERREHEARVVATIDTMFGLAVYADYRYLNSLVDQGSAVSAVQMKANQEPEFRREFLRNLKRYPSLEGFADVAQQKKMMQDDFVAMMNTMAVPLVMFAAVIFFGSILNGSLIAILERVRQISTFRVLGYRPLEVGNIFFRENLAQNMVGTVLGLPLGWLILKAMSVEFANDMYEMPCVVRPVSYVYSVALAVAFVAAAQVIVQKVLSGIDWSQALKMKE